ncbi:glucose-6-phosphatase 3-like [Lampetra fluviatilis]
MEAAVYAHGVEVAARLQAAVRGPTGTAVEAEGAGHLVRLLLLASDLGDPRTAHLLLMPLSHGLSPGLGRAVLWVALMAEWLNLVLKWLLFGERPYWWVLQSGLNSTGILQLEQFPNTCETGPGSPSGHVMVSAAAWVVLAAWTSARLRSITNKWVAWAVSYGTLLALLSAVGVSRIYILAHFPHQVLGGTLAGLFLGQVLGRYLPKTQRLLPYVAWSLSLLGIAFAMFYGMQFLGFNMNWSVQLAERWCMRREWVRLDTTPLASLMRDSGACLGLGLAAWPGAVPAPGSRRSRLACTAASLGILHAAEWVRLPGASPAIFYLLCFAKSTLVPIIAMLAVPLAVGFASGSGKALKRN